MEYYRGVPYRQLNAYKYEHSLTTATQMRTHDICTACNATRPGKRRAVPLSAMRPDSDAPRP